MAEPNIYNNEEENGIDVSICEQAELTEISKGGLIKSNSLPDIYDMVVETGINIALSICELELPETANAEVIRSKRRSKLKLTGAFLTAMVMMLAGAGLCYMVYYFTPSNTDNTRVNVTATDDGHVTAIDDVCFDFRANCNTSLIETNITGKNYIKLPLFTYFQINSRINNCENS